jgi:hypothetical protein
MNRIKIFIFYIHGISKNSLFKNFTFHFWLIFSGLVVGKMNF